MKSIEANTIRKNEVTPLVVWATILYIFIAIGRIQEYIPINLYLGKIFGILMILAFILHSGQKNRVTLRESPEIISISGILLFAFLSVPFGVWPGASVDFIINAYVKNFILCFILAYILVTPNQIYKTGFTLIISSSILAVIGFVNRTGITRIRASTFYDPNDFAFLLVCVLPFVIFNSFKEKGMKKVFLLLSASLMITVIILTRSRGGFIGLLVIGAVILFKTIKKSKGLAGFILLIFLAVFTFATPSGYWERMETIVEPGDDYNIYSPSGRIEVWKRGIKLITKNPITGIGIGNFATAEGSSREDTGRQKEPWKTAHNSFIQIGGELGIGGLFLFVLLIYNLLKTLRKIKSTDLSINTLRDSLEVSLIGYVTGGFFLSQAYGTVIYFLTGMTIALKYVVKRSDLNHV